MNWSSFLKKNKRLIIYDYERKQYSMDGNLYCSFEEARSKQCKCDKCDDTFRSLKQLHMHKRDKHSY